MTRVGVFGGRVLRAIRTFRVFTGQEAGFGKFRFMHLSLVRCSAVVAGRGCCCAGCHLCHGRASSVPGLCLSSAGDGQGHLQSGAGVSWRAGALLRADSRGDVRSAHKAGCTAGPVPAAKGRHFCGAGAGAGVGGGGARTEAPSSPPPGAAPNRGLGDHPSFTSGGRGRRHSKPCSVASETRSGQSSP